MSRRNKHRVQSFVPGRVVPDIGESAADGQAPSEDSATGVFAASTGEVVPDGAISMVIEDAPTVTFGEGSTPTMETLAGDAPDAEEPSLRPPYHAESKEFAAPSAYNNVQTAADIADYINTFAVKNDAALLHMIPTTPGAYLFVWDMT